MPEQLAGKYQMLRRLASGGMGEVFLAALHRAEGFAKLVVVKRILPAYAQDPEFLAMFIQEARLSATLDHPNIVRVYDFGRAGDSFFLAMEYLHGDSLLALLPRAVASPEGLSLEVTLTIMLGVCAGLHFAHEHRGPDGQPLGIVHRDISPANVFVTHAGEVKVLDFGIARAVSASAVTREGVRKGKVSYMSPEQCLGAPLDARSDVFAIGILLHEMTTMKRLFRGNSEFETMQLITSGQVPAPSSRALNYPPALEAVVLRALATDPDRRYPSAQALHDDLERVAVELDLRPSATVLGRFVRDLTHDKRYPSLDPDADADDAPTQNFFATVNELVTVGDIPIEPSVAPSPPAEPATPAPRRPTRSLLIGLGVLIALGSAAFMATRSAPAPTLTPPPEPASPPRQAPPAPVDEPATEPAAELEPEPAAEPEPSPKASPRKRRSAKKRGH